MTDWIVLGVFWGAILAWGGYRWFRPSPWHRYMIRLHEEAKR